MSCRGEEADLSGNIRRFAPHLADLVVRSAGAICDYVEHLHTHQRAPRYVDFEVVGIDVWQGNVIAKGIVRQEILGDETIQDFSVLKSHPDPQSVHPGAAQEDLSFRSVAMPVKIANEINALNLIEREIQEPALQIQ